MPSSGLHAPIKTTVCLTCKPKEVFDGEPRDADSLDEGQLGVVDGVALLVPVLDGGDGVEGHPHGGDDHKSDGYHRYHLSRKAKNDVHLSYA